MSKDPAFLFYSSDFLTGVSDLTFEERGQYITLLCLQHQKGRLTEKAIKIAVPNATADVLAKFKKDKEGLYFNKRLEIEADKRAKHAEKQRQRAIDGWKKRKRGQSPDNATADATALPLENEDVNENIVTNENKTRGAKFNFKTALVEHGASEHLASDWLKVRKAKKAANTQTALNGFVREVQKTDKSIDQVLTVCIERSWKGFKADWLVQVAPKSDKTESIMEKLSRI